MEGASKRYALTMIVCIIVVNAFAFVQYHFIQNHPFEIRNYSIPSLVGAGFGFLIARNKILQDKYHYEKDQVMEKNKKIHMYVGTIVHDLKSPVSAIYSLVELLGLQEDLKSKKSQKFLGEFMTLSAKSTGGEVATGLGLSVTKKLVEEMGGIIWAESEGKGKGSTFKIALPLAPPG